MILDYEGSCEVDGFERVDFTPYRALYKIGDSPVTVDLGPGDVLALHRQLSEALDEWGIDYD